MWQRRRVGQSKRRTCEETFPSSDIQCVAVICVIARDGMMMSESRALSSRQRLIAEAAGVEGGEIGEVAGRMVRA
jgi:hypothetical protein